MQLFLTTPERMGSMEKGHFGRWKRMAQNLLRGRSIRIKGTGDARVINLLLVAPVPVNRKGFYSGINQINHCTSVFNQSGPSRSLSQRYDAWEGSSEREDPENNDMKSVLVGSNHRMRKGNIVSGLPISWCVARTLGGGCSGTVQAEEIFAFKYCGSAADPVAATRRRLRRGCAERAREPSGYFFWGA